MTAPRYASPPAFKHALEQRLRDTGDLERRRQLLVYKRLLARLVATLGDSVTLKGGLGLEMRLKRARTTRDIDLRMFGPTTDLLAHLQLAGRLDLGDFMSFSVRPDPHHPTITGVRYEGQRFTVRCAIGHTEYARPFGLDVAFADPMLGEPDPIVADDTLGFAGVTPPTVRVYPVATHIAEKLHAYTLPRPRPNSRIKDLPDLALLATTGELLASTLRAALVQTFDFRATHPIPPRLPEPPPEWAAAYERMATQDHLPWPTLPELEAAARRFLDPALTRRDEARWSPTRWTWAD